MTASTKPPVSELKIGPFSGGINRYSDNSAIADTELVDCVNFDIDLDGSLKSRPPWKTLYAATNTVYTQTYVEGSTQVLGSFVFNLGDRGVVYQFIERLTSPDSINAHLRVYFIDGPSAGNIITFKTLTNLEVDNPFTSVTRYKNILYFTRAKGGGGKIDMGSAVYTDLPSLPAGSKGVIYKERFWITGNKGTDSSRMYFSDVSAPETFQPASFYDVRPGDGETLNDIILYQDNLYLFKNASIWVFSYDTQPSQAVLTQLHDDLGVENSWSSVLYENVIYFLKWNQVYQIANYDITRISTKLPFEDDRTLPIGTGVDWNNTQWKFPNWLSLVGDRLVVRFYNRLYVYHLRIRSWTRWDSQDNNVKYIGQIFKVETANASNKFGFDTYVGGTSLTKPPYAATTGRTINALMQMGDTYDATSREGITRDTQPPVYVDINLNVKTKIYDIGISHRFKRILHWGVDIVTGRTVTGTLYPFSLAYRVTWAQLHSLTWNQLQTWGYPLFVQPSNSQTAVVDTGVYRRYIRFPKSLRFRLLQFGVDLQTQGNTSDGPARIYTITAFVVKKELVPKGVN